jgi:hypothetical protein
MNPAAEFLLKKKGPVGLIPLLRLVRSAGEAGYTFGSALRESSEEQWSRGVYSPTTDLASPEILKYEDSALGSTRII